MSGDHNMHCSANDPENLLTVVFRGLSADQKREIINRDDAVHLRHGNAVRDLRTEALVLREKLDMLQHDPGHQFCHRLAVMLECALLDPVGTWDEAHAVLDEYRKAVQAWHEASGEAYVSPLGKD